MVEKFIVEGNELPEWLRTSFLDDCSEVYLACGAFDDEMTALLCLAHDCVPMVRDGKHVYAPITWLARQYPKHAEAVRIIADVVRKAAEGAPVGTS